MYLDIQVIFYLCVLVCVCKCMYEVTRILQCGCVFQRTTCRVSVLWGQRGPWTGVHAVMADSRCLYLCSHLASLVR